jgi:two-component system chemotaxis response regulator CheY
MDIVMRTMGGIEAVREICRTDPDAKVLDVQRHGTTGAGGARPSRPAPRTSSSKPFQPSRVLEAVQRVLG